MQLMNPGYLLLSILIGAVIIFYMFRKRYENKVIPSNLLWEQVMNEWQASPWIDKLQRNILLFLQVFILLLLMLALTKPFWMTKGIQGENLIVIIDHSASMAATKDGITRFEEAKKELYMLMKQISGQEVTVITVGATPEIVVNKGTNINEITETIDKLDLSYEYSDIKKAIRLANSLIVNKETSLFIFSDAVIEEDLEEIDERQPVTVINLGEENANLSLKSFGVANDGKQITGIVTIENQSEKQQSTTLQINSNKKILFEQDVTIDAGEWQLVNIPKLPEREYYKAKLRIDDGYLLDNELITINQQAISTIYTFGEISPFMIQGLENIGYDVIQYEDVTSNNSDMSNGIVLIENIPIESWPKGPIFAIAPQQEKVIDLKAGTNTIDDPLFQYVDFQDTYIHSAYTETGIQLPVIAESEGIPLIQKGEIDSAPHIILNFSLENTDWPLHPGFPIFLYHSFQWLSNQDNFFGFFQPGEKRWINDEDENSEWKLFNETGEFIKAFKISKESFIAPRKPGLYQTVTKNQKQYLAVNLDDRERASPVSPSFTLNQQQEDSIQAIDVRPYEQLWFWLTLVALLLLFIEWEVMRRGARI